MMREVHCAHADHPFDERPVWNAEAPCHADGPTILLTNDCFVCGDAIDWADTSDERIASEVTITGNPTVPEGCIVSAHASCLEMTGGWEMA